MEWMRGQGAAWSTSGEKANLPNKEEEAGVRYGSSVSFLRLHLMRGVRAARSDSRARNPVERESSYSALQAPESQMAPTRPAVMGRPIHTATW